MIRSGSRFRALDQPSRQPEPSPQRYFLTRHLPVVALMIETRQMKYSVQSKNLHFLRNGVAQAHSILRRDIGRNCDVASHQPLACTNRSGWKRQDIGSLILSAKPAIERAHFGTARDQNIYRALQLRRPPNPPHKTFKHRLAQAHDFLSQNDQGTITKSFLLSLPHSYNKKEDR
jgi:hypothetical protein